MSKRSKNAQREADRRQQAVKDEANFCGAIKRNGSPCHREAGWGTDHKGYGRCKHHTGSTHSGKLAAAKAETSDMATSLRVTPAQGLLGVLHLAAGQLQFVTQKVAELPEKDLLVNTPFGTAENPWLRLQRQIMQDVAKFSRSAADMGIQERQQNLAETQTSLVAQLMEKVLGELDLTPAQRKQVGPAIREHLTLVVDNEEQAA